MLASSSLWLISTSTPMEAPFSLAVTSCMCITTLQNTESLVRTNGTKWEEVLQLHWRYLWEALQISMVLNSIWWEYYLPLCARNFFSKIWLSDFYIYWVQTVLTDSSKEFGCLALQKMRPHASCCQALLNNFKGICFSSRGNEKNYSN